MAKGGSNAAIGDALFISARSVEKHIGSVFTKFDLTETDDVHRRVRAVLVYLGALQRDTVTARPRKWGSPAGPPRRRER